MENPKINYNQAVFSKKRESYLTNSGTFKMSGAQSPYMQSTRQRVGQNKASFKKLLDREKNIKPDTLHAIFASNNGISP